MEAVEFEAHIEDGIIRVPDLLRDRLTGSVRVIVLTEERDLEGRDMIGRLLENPRRVEGFKPLTRDEIYEQRAAT